eukprot:Tbor_TRINITY_DN1729_c0_g1::TRINITY_DN1729_c0_g1_i1::g.21274::m.21274
MTDLLSIQDATALKHGPCCQFLAMRLKAIKRRNQEISNTNHYQKKHQQEVDRHQDKTAITKSHGQSPPLRSKADSSYVSERPKNSVKHETQTHGRTPDNHVNTVNEIEEMPLPAPGGVKVDFDRAYERPPTSAVMEECPLCIRRFNADRIAKHIEVCQKSNKKRKEYDTKAVRVQQLYEPAMAEAVLKKLEEGDDPIEMEKLRKVKERRNWRKHSSNAGSSTGGSSVPSVLLDDRIACPGCGRKFSETASEKHIPKCVEKAKMGSNRFM